MNIQTGQWVGVQSGLGAGQDSFYEYLLKVRFTLGFFFASIIRCDSVWCRIKSAVHLCS